VTYLTYQTLVSDGKYLKTTYWCMFAALQPVFYCFKHLKIYLLSIFYEEMVRLETTIIH